MRVAYLVNDASDLDPRQTTVMLMAGSAARDHSVWVFGVQDLACLADGSLTASARPVRHDPAGLDVEALAHTSPEPIVLDELDLLVLRTNPGRDAPRLRLHDQASRMLGLLCERNVQVVNDPEGARWCGSKLFLQCLSDDLKPRALVSCHAGELEAFVRASRDATVLKPLDGTWGADVYRVAPQHLELKGVIKHLLDQGGYVIAQEFLPAVADGDVRLLLLDGAPLMRDGLPAAVRRMPPAGDFRCNVHLGGLPTRVPRLSPVLARIAEQVGPLLRDRGVVLAGVDVVGDRVLEVNAFAPGGLGDAQEFQGVDFLTPILDAFEARCTLSC